MTTAVPDTVRRTFAAIADILIPKTDGMPSASQVAVHRDGLDSVLAVRPDLQEPLLRGLRAAGSGDPGEALDALKRTDPVALAAIGETARSAYYLDPGVRELLRYPGQLSRPATADEEFDYLQDGMLQAVMDRGPIYRPAPNAKRGDETSDDPEI